eukprot:INCI2687.1.p1 GENE.INCI2687.1~~INCI2687.1.p1  ORF type:complete len:499 (+),score=92.74 INCI2687.1:365-1861(+)
MSRKSGAARPSGLRSDRAGGARRLPAKSKHRSSGAHLSTKNAAVSAAPSEAWQQRTSTDLVSTWKGSVGKFLFKGYDDEAAYYVRPLTESEIWLRDEADAWEEDMRLKIDKKREGQLRRELAMRDMRVANNDHDVEAMKKRLLAAVVNSTRSEREKQVEKERHQPEYQHRLAVAQQVAMDKADVFRQLNKEKKISISSHEKMSRAFDALTAKLQGLREEIGILQASAAAKFRQAQELKGKIIKPGDRISDKVEKLFESSALDAAAAEKLRDQLQQQTQRQERSFAECAAAAQQLRVGDAEGIAQHISKCSRNGTDADIKAIVVRADSNVFWSSAPVQLAAAQAMWFLSSPSKVRWSKVQVARDSLVAHGAIASLVRMLQLHRSNLSILDPWALGALAFLTECPLEQSQRPGIERDNDQTQLPKYSAIQAMAVNDGALPALLQLLKRGEPCAQDDHAAGLAVRALQAVVGNSAANLRIAFDEGELPISTLEWATMNAST